MTSNYFVTFPSQPFTYEAVVLPSVAVTSRYMELKFSLMLISMLFKCVTLESRNIEALNYCIKAAGALACH